MINRAWRSIRDARQWSFLKEVCGIYCPTQVTAGTVSFALFGTTVTCDATASAALLAVVMPAGLDLTALQIRFGGSGNTSAVGQIYNIASFDDTTPSAVVLTLDREIMQPANATSGYQVYRAYFKPTVDDFLNWISFVDTTNGLKLRLNFSSTYFDVRDPQRQAQGQAYYVGGFIGNPGTQPKPQYELWPHPTSGQTFLGRFQRQGEDFSSAADQQSPIIPDSLILARAFAYHGYPWAATNVGNFPALKGTNWAQQMLDARKEYQEELLSAKRNDNEQELNDVWARGHGLIHGNGGYGRGMWDGPIDSNWIQSHLVNF